MYDTTTWIVPTVFAEPAVAVVAMLRVPPTLTVSAPVVRAHPVRAVADPRVRFWSAPAPHLAFIADRLNPVSAASVTVISGV